MRAALLAIACAGLPACAPDIVAGAYLCGPEASCPEGQACNGSDNTCVLPSTALAFACKGEHEPDDASAQARTLSNLACVSVPAVIDDCLHAGDVADWVNVATPSTCTSVEISAKITFPVAFEPLVLELWVDDGLLATGKACVPPPGADTGEDQRCLKATVSPGTTYSIQVRPAGGGDCGGQCNYNRYQLTVQLDTPG